MSRTDWIALRFVGGLVALAVAAVAAVVFMVATGALDAGQLAGDWLPGHATLIAAMKLNRAAVLAGALFVGLLAMIVFVRTIAPARGPRSALHMLSADERGFVVIDSRGIATIATQAALGIRGVVEAEVHVNGNGTNPVRLRVDVGVYPGANIKRAGDETRHAVQEVVEQLVGVKIRDVRVAVRVLDPDRLSTLLA